MERKEIKSTLSYDENVQASLHLIRSLAQHDYRLQDALQSLIASVTSVMILNQSNRSGTHNHAGDILTVSLFTEKNIDPTEFVLFDKSESAIKCDQIVQAALYEKLFIPNFILHPALCLIQEIMQDKVIQEYKIKLKDLYVVVKLKSSLH